MRPDWRYVLGAVVFAILVIFGPTNLISSDGDFALHVLLGRLMIEQGGLLPTEPTLHTVSAPFMAHEWLTQLVYGALDGVLGLRGPVWLASAFVGAAVATVYAQSRQRATPVIALIFTLCGAALCINHLHARPHTLTWLLAPIWVGGLRALEDGRLDPKGWALRYLPLVMVWTWAHGGFAVSLYLFGLFGLARLARLIASPDADSEVRGFTILFGLGVAALVATFVNPWGPMLHAHVLSFMGDETLDAVTTEFAPPNFGTPQHQLFFLGAAALFALLALGGASSIDILLAVGMFVLALRAARDIALFGLISAPIAAASAQRLLDGAAEGSWLSRLRPPDLDDRGSPWPLGLAFVALLIAPVPTFDATILPVHASATIASAPPQGRMFNAYHWGGYLSLRLHPAQKVWINGFNDHYGGDLITRYQKVRHVEAGWSDELEDADWVVYMVDSDLAEALDDHPAWKRTYTDELAGIWVRTR